MLVPKIEPTDLDALSLEESPLPMTMAGWVSPAGDYFRVEEEWGHSLLADRIVGEPGDTWARLNRNGWVHLSEQGRVDIEPEFQLTKAQINTLFDIATLVPDSAFALKIISTLRDEG